MTPRAWLGECDMPLLSTGTPKTPVSDALSIRNDSPDMTYQGCRPSEQYPSDAPGCEGTAKVADAQSNAGPEHVKSCAFEGSPAHPSWVCNDCGQDRYGKPNGMSTWHYDYCRFCGEFVPCTEPRDFGDRLGDRHDGEPVETVWACPACAGLQGRHDCGQNEEPAAETHEDLQGKDADSFVVTSCPECGAATDIDYATVKDKPPDCQGYGEHTLDDNPLLNHMECTFNSCMDIAVAKNEGYAGSADPMANFKDSVRLGVPVPIGVAIRLSDKWARLCRLLQTGENPLSDESITDTILDSINYLAILLYALEGEA